MSVSIVTPKGETQLPEEAAETDSQIEIDSAVVRNNIYQLMQQGQDVLQYAIDLAKQSDSPRAFEVVGTLMSNLASMNMQLMDNHEKKSKLKIVRKESDSPQKVVNNSIVFQGSTAELNKMLQNMRKES